MVLGEFLSYLRRLFLFLELFHSIGLGGGDSCCRESKKKVQRAVAAALVLDFLNSIGGRWGSCGPWIEHFSRILAGFHGGVGAVEAGVEVGAVPEAHPGVGPHGGVRQPGAPRLPG